MSQGNNLRELRVVLEREAREKDQCPAPTEVCAPADAEASTHTKQSADSRERISCQVSNLHNPKSAR